MVVVVIEADDITMRKEKLITATIMIVIHQILTNPHIIRRNKQGYWSRTCCIAKHLVDLY
jgi:hypothetical protein